MKEIVEVTGIEIQVTEIEISEETEIDNSEDREIETMVDIVIEI